MQNIVTTGILMTFIIGSGAAMGFGAMNNYVGNYEDCEHIQDCDYDHEECEEHNEEECLNEHEECPEEGHHYERGC